MTEQSHKYAKYGVLATLLAAIIGGAITLYTHFDSKGLQVDEIPSSVEQKDRKETASLSIKDVQLTPVDFDIPSSFYIEIENGPHRVAKNIDVVIDFGEAKIEKCSVKPNDQSNISINLLSTKFSSKLSPKNLLTTTNCRHPFGESHWI